MPGRNDRHKSHTPLSDKTVPTEWGGAPLFLGQWIVTLGQACADEMQADENALISLGTNTNSRGTPIYWNRLHMLCRQQATSTGNLLIYEWGNSHRSGPGG